MGAPFSSKNLNLNIPPSQMPSLATYQKSILPVILPQGPGGLELS